MNETITQSQLEQILAAEPFIAEVDEHSDTSPFLNLFFSAERNHVTQSFTELHFNPGEIVFRENTPGDTMYIVLSGRFAILKGDLDSPTIIGYRGEGGIVGEMALLDNQPRSATIVALDKLHLLGINRQNFRQLLEAIPSVSLRIMETLSSRLRKSDEVLSQGNRSERQLINQVSMLQSEKQRLEELQRLREETSELIIHDLRNPLSAIAISLKMLSVMLPEDVLQPHRQLLDVAQTSVERMRRLVDTLLEVARMESGETELSLHELDLPPLLKEIVERVSIIDRKGIDRYKIDRVVTNLLDNALKYTPESGLVRITAYSQENFVCVNVTDNGPGIPPDQRERIFERFAQVEGERRSRRGFGLGLAYCRLAVERHGGRIWVEEGEDGAGSQFIFTLPVSKPINQ
jgi:signal transduction histidine kinase